MQTFQEQLDHLIQSALAEDIGNGDHSTLSAIPADAKGKAVLKIKQDGILAGVSVAKRIFEMTDPSIRFIQHKMDGEVMRNGEIAFEVEAHIHTILQCERLALNCMQRMSGIATLTNVYVKAIEGYKTRILDTRKTTPNFRLLEKEAVRIGGGVNHRMGLYDMIMLKDNHIDYAGGLESAIQRAYDYVQQYHPHLKIEVETRNIEEVEQVVNFGKVDRIMLDNFTPEQIEAALKIINGTIETEASGGINLDNLKSYAATGVDYVSIGALIHQAKSLDLSLKAVIV
ncbi:carboxylating nicotinate-nucleotide diphosphorylase [Gynurincola endophyticus]|uniref:carboxylating nicotinate-nucleotide diphosphorylase n=1 Tax=Gynurincola endophyticus TaxID=2479004 RepID=UPI000F8C300F|nr:carboxylating nicotinate-nucleotide diphosphorylase [Gynurincola endophyticus]